MSIPKFDDLFNPLLESLHELGGSGTVNEIERKVTDKLKLSEKEINLIHKGNRTVLSYRLTWTRNYLKRYGLIEISSRGIWALTNEGRETHNVDNKIVDKSVRSINKKENQKTITEIEEEIWKEELLKVILEIQPVSFEILCQRILRESGFIEVEITGRTGDGGIDGKGIMRIGNLLSFRILFQCKRYKGSVSSKLVRDFRGAIQGRGDKGLIITTGTFTRDARIESVRDGAIPIDLVDGEDLAELMKKLNLGVIKKIKEIYEVDENWIKSF